MQELRNSDLQNCLSIQPKKHRSSVSYAAQELVSELLVLVGDDSNKAMGVIREIMYYSPNNSLEWYCEQAIAKLNRLN